MYFNLLSYMYLFVSILFLYNDLIRTCSRVMSTTQSVLVTILTPPVTNLTSTSGGMRQRLRWADGKLVKEAIDQQLAALLGPRGQDTPQEEVYIERQEMSYQRDSQSNTTQCNSPKAVKEKKYMNMYIHENHVHSTLAKQEF